MSSNRQRKLDAVVARLQLQYGLKAVRKAAPPAEPVARLSTTFAGLDRALDGGLPRGRITEIIGAATSGKATLAAKVLATAQTERNAHSTGSGQALVAWLDLPRTSDPDYLHCCGVDLSRLLVVRPRDAADGKLMVGLAAFAPLALGMGVLLEVAVFITRRLRGRRDTPIPGALWLYLGSVLSVAVWVVLAFLGIGHFH